jgi:hypothetical protein
MRRFNMLNFLEVGYWNTLKKIIIQKTNESKKLGFRITDEDCCQWAAQERDKARVDWDEEFSGVKKWVNLDPYIRDRARIWVYSLKVRVIRMQVGDVLKGYEFSVFRESKEFYQVCYWDWNATPSLSRDRWVQIGYMSRREVEAYGDLWSGNAEEEYNG